jgi:hypothetical protein
MESAGRNAAGVHHGYGQVGLGTSRHGTVSAPFTRVAARDGWPRPGSVGARLRPREAVVRYIAARSSGVMANASL